MKHINLDFNQNRPTFKEKVRAIEITRPYFLEGGRVREVKDEHLKGCGDYYEVSTDLITALKEGIYKYSRPVELIAAPRPVDIIPTTFVFNHTPSETTFYEAWIFRGDWEGGFDVYLVSPRVGYSLTHHVLKHPILIYADEDTSVEEVVKAQVRRELREGYCILCDTKLPEEPDHFEWRSSWQEGEPDVPTWVCPNCEGFNYGLVGNLWTKREKEV